MNLDGGAETRHVKRVLAAIAHDAAVSNPKSGSKRNRVPRTIEASWRRCVLSHGIEPHKVRQPVILSHVEVTPLRDRFDVLKSIFAPELDRLHERLAKLDYVVLLANADGITVDVRCSDEIDKEARDSGLYPGVIWKEDFQGTNGVGTCLATGQPISVVMDDHFAIHNTPLTCTVAPIYSPDQELIAALDVSTPRPTDHQTQQLVMQIVANAARRIENQLFMAHFQSGHAIVALSQDSRFSDLASATLLAMSSGGRVAAWSPAAKTLLDPVIERSTMEYRLQDQVDLFIRTRAEGEEPIVLEDVTSGRFFARCLSDGETVQRQKSGPQARAKPRARQEPTSKQISEVIVGADPVMERNFALAARIVDAGLPILVTGETGSGKEVFAKHLHRISARAKGPFVAVNCAAIPETLIEGELFGYRPGAFTGAAKSGYRGKVAEANGGVLFLDEIGDMPLELQTRLLRVLSEMELTPLGGAPIALDLLVISSTHQDLEALVAEGRFREDLFYRIAGANLTIPPLRARRDRRLFITEMFEGLCDAAGRDLTLTPEVLHLFETYPWPGNVRELQQILRYAIAVSESETVELTALPARLTAALEPRAASSHKTETERLVIEQTLKRCHGKVSAAAELLGISRSTMHRRMKRLGVKR
ncbi:sigma-54-dependent Fis family transcriptional regulator [Denitrobaculum tricleocarpae]|uniref:Sigma-54-dependent Fis family transcriptional regulator n=1 Tax=Denitrobaculum tricleocarpae TaxID=2591009 RepID=A0A545TEV6_9PROT|nr:sigma-54-dependent Fis family transcriptional regulator [Denitrobaculum tricleocarpae]TQV75762.1 sigma-54-dependent Fis family transcriptional regulator [Denitrobaculum tricleocarpae]